MIRRTVAALACLLALTVSPTQAAQPDPGQHRDGCATLREYRAVERGMSPARVAGITDTTGDRVYKRARKAQRYYDLCWRTGWRGFAVTYRLDGNTGKWFASRVGRKL